MIKASKKKQKLEDMVHSIKLCGKEDDKEEKSCSPSPFLDTLGVCDEVLSHEEGGNNPQINTFFNFMPSGISPRKGGLCLLSFVEEKYGIHAEAYKEGEVLSSGILNKKVDSSFENNSMGPFLRYFEH